MPPKKRVTARKTAEVSYSQVFRANPSISKIYDEVATAHDNAVGALFADALMKIVEKANEVQPSSSHDQLHALFGGKMENQITELITRQPQSASPPVVPSSSRSTRASSRMKRSVKKELDEQSDIVTIAEDEEMEMESLAKNRDVLGEVDMETDDDIPSGHVTPRMATPTELRETVKRMQHMSISRTTGVISSTSRSATSTLHRTPTRAVTRTQTQPTTPRHVFPPTTPGRSVAAPRTPGRVLAPPPVEKEDKMKHAEELRTKVLENKKAKLKAEEIKRAAVMERKKEQEMERLARIEEQRKRDEEKVANLLRLQKEHKSPTRARPPTAELKTPKSKATASRKVFPTAEPSVPTPGRGPAKRTRVEVPGVRGGKPKTVAAPAGQISPSRQLQRTRFPVRLDADDMDISDDSPPLPVKPIAKARRSQTKPTTSIIAQAAAAAEAAAKENAAQQKAAAKADAEAKAAALLREQEQYLLKQAEAARIAAEEKEKARQEKKRQEEKRQEEKRQEEKRQEEKAAKEKAEAERRAQADEMARLKAIQEEEARRLREQSEREEKELQEVRKRQEEKDARQLKAGRTPPPTAYEMTPPRTFKAKSKDDYGLHDLNSDDETDQEDDPRKEVPAWADFAVVRDSVRKQIANPPFDVASFFGEIEKPDLKSIFGDQIKVKKRGSSAVWKSPCAPTQHSRSVLDEISE